MSRVPTLFLYKLRFFFGPTLRGRLGPLVSAVAVRPPFAGKAFDQDTELRDRNFIQLPDFFGLALRVPVAAGEADCQCEPCARGQKGERFSKRH